MRGYYYDQTGEAPRSTPAPIFAGRRRRWSGAAAVLLFLLTMALLGGLTAAASIPPRAVQGLSASPQTGRFPPRCIIMILSNRRLRMGRIGAHSWRGPSCLPIRWPLAIRFLPPRWMTIIPAPAAFIA